jgi:hypothetical protein
MTFLVISDKWVEFRGTSCSWDEELFLRWMNHKLASDMMWKGNRNATTLLFSLKFYIKEKRGHVNTIVMEHFNSFKILVILITPYRVKINIMLIFSCTSLDLLTSRIPINQSINPSKRIYH